MTEAYDALANFESAFPETVALEKMKSRSYKMPSNISEFEPVTAEKMNPFSFGRYPEPIDRSDELIGVSKEVYIKLMNTGTASADALVSDKLKLADVLFTLTQLEMFGYVTVSAGGIYSIK